MKNIGEPFAGNTKAVHEILACYGLKARHFRPFRKVLKVQTSCGTKALKRSRLTADELLFIHEAKEHLWGKGFVYTDRFLTTQKNEPFAIIEKSVYTLTDWIAGSREFDYDAPGDLLIATFMMAHFHEMSAGFFPKTLPTERLLWANWPDRYQHRLAQLSEFYQLAERKKRKSNFDGRFLSHFEYFYRQGELFLKLLPQSSYRRISAEGMRRGEFCHHDFSPRNLLHAPNHKIYLIDFDYCICEIRLHDLGSLLIRNMKTNGWDLELAVYILKNYHNSYALTREEFDVLWLFMMWPQDFWQVGLQYYKEKQPWPKKRFYQSLQKKIKDIRPREVFLNRFPDLWPLK
ncbi:MAG: CotS family spore coat protein [Bacillota bacterium]